MHVGIVGCGIFGASAALALAQRGHRVTVFDRGGPPARRRGERRPLEGAALRVRRALRALRAAGRGVARRVPRAGRGATARRSTSRRACWPWRARSTRRATSACRTTSCAPPAGRSTLLDPRRRRARFPQFAWDGIAAGTWNPEGGYVRALEAVRATLAAARALGVDVAAARASPTSTSVRARRSSSSTAARRTSSTPCSCCGGPWLGRFLPAEARCRARAADAAVRDVLPPAVDGAGRAVRARGVARRRRERLPGVDARPHRLGLVRHAARRRACSRSRVTSPARPADPDAPRVVTDADREASRAFVAAHDPGDPPRVVRRGPGLPLRDDRRRALPRRPRARRRPRCSSPAAARATASRWGRRWDAWPRTASRRAGRKLPARRSRDGVPGGRGAERAGGLSERRGRSISRNSTRSPSAGTRQTLRRPRCSASTRR